MRGEARGGEARGDGGSGGEARGRVRGAVRAVAGAALLLCALQAGRWALETAAFALVPRTPLADELVRTAALLLMFAAVALLARRRGADLRLLPRDEAGRVRVGPGYGGLLAAFALLFAATPFLTGQQGEPAAWAALACATLATPLVEETLFRGYLWDRLRPVLGEGWKLVLVTAALFGLWHLGYADAVAWQLAQRGAASVPADLLAGVMLAKAAFAAAMGAVLGAARMRWGCCLAPALLHAFWNCLA